MSDDFEKNLDGGNNENENSMGGLFDKLNSMSDDLSSSTEAAASSSESAADAGESESNTGGEKSPDIFMPEKDAKEDSKDIDKTKEKKIGKIDIGDLKSAFDTGKQPIVKPVEVKKAPRIAKEAPSAKAEPAKAPAKPPAAPEKVDLPKKEAPAKSAPPASKPESKPPVPPVPAPKAAPASPKAAPTVQPKETKAPESKPLVQRVSGLTAKLPTLFKRNKDEAPADISTSTKPAASAPVSDAKAPATPVKSAEAKPKAPATPAAPANKPPIKTPAAATPAPKAASAVQPVEPKASEGKPLAQRVSGFTAKIPALFKRGKEDAASAPAVNAKPPVKQAATPAPQPRQTAAPTANPAKPLAPPASAAQSPGKRFSPENTAPAAPAPQSGRLENKYAPTIQPVVKRRDIKKKQKMSGGKKAAIAVAIVAGLAAIGAGLWFFLFKDMFAAQNSDPVFVTSVGQLAGMDMGTNPRYSAVVDPQKSVEVTKDDTKQIAEYFVDVGDEVQEGTPLFSYNTEDMQLSLTQAEIDLEGIGNRITTLKAQIADLEKQREKAPADEKPSYTLQISTAQLDVKTEEYNSSLKSAEIDKIKLDIENAEVLSPAAGVIKEMNKTAQTDPMTGQPKPFISIVARGDYRIRGTVTELNIADITIGQSVIVHSRVNPDETWQGTVESIDMENPVSGNGNDKMVYIDGGDQNNQSSKYYFYVVLQDYTGLMLGQHVYLEPDTGIDTTDRAGIWLPSFYIAHDESMDFVWARDPETEKLIKKEVIIGEFDDESDLCQIISGVVPEDYIAYPSDEYIEGMPTTIDRYSAADPNAPNDMPEGDAGIDTGMIGTPEGDDFTDDGLTDDGMTDNGLNDDVTITTPEGGDEYGYYDDDGNFVPMENPDAGTSGDGITFYDESGLG